MKTDLPMLRGMHYGSHNWYRQCGSKRAYFTFAAALKAFYEVLPKPCHNKHNAPLTIYRCGWCEWYHLGHLPKRQSRGEGTVFSEIRRPDWWANPRESRHYVGSFAKIRNQKTEIERLTARIRELEHELKP